MRRLTILRASLFTALSLLLAPAGAAWAGWLANGNPVCTASGEQGDIAVAPDGAGGMFVVWRDQRRGPTFNDLYGSHVLQDGTVATGWPVNGLALSQSGTASKPWPIANGAGGLLVLWLDGSTLTPRMQSVSGDGVLAAGFPADGMAISITVGGPAGYNFRAVGDGAGGAFVQWSAYSFSGSYDVLYVTDVTGTGAFAPGWTAGGVAVGGSPFTFGRAWVQLTLATDPAGGVLSGEVLNLEDEPSGSSYVGHLQRVQANGSSGLSVALAPDGWDNFHRYVVGLSDVPDGAGGAFAAWHINPPSGAALYMQHYLANGSASWPTTAAPVMDATFTDGAGGVYLLGRPLGLDQLELHRRAGNGSVPAGWGTGVLLSGTGSYSAFQGVLSGGRVFACWSNGSAGAHDLFGACVNGDGSLSAGWTAGGTVVCNATGMQVLSGVVPGAANDALLAWSDARAGNGDVYAARLAPDGPVVLDVPGGAGGVCAALAVERVRPDPARAAAELAFTLPGPGAASVEVLDLAGRVVERFEPAGEPGRQVMALDTARLASGLYLARVRQGTRAAVRRFTVLH